MEVTGELLQKLGPANPYLTWGGNTFDKGREFFYKSSISKGKSLFCVK